MGILIGMDEAGYGPHYGPLAVAGTAWYVPDNDLAANAASGIESEVAQELSAASTCAVMSPPKRATRKSPADCADLYRLLRNVVAKSVNERRIAIADSKALYQPGQGLRHLERGLHAVLMAMQESHNCWSSFVRFCQADVDGHHSHVCWPDGFDSRLPVDAAVDELARLGARLERACAAAGVRPLVIRAKLIYPEQFNNLTDHYGSKGAALSHIATGLLREIVDAVTCLRPNRETPAPIYAVCDKHGGRNFYASLLQHHFSEHWVAPVYETHAESRYEWGAAESRTRVIFRVNGECFMPTALASMTAKYLRELSMRAFNEFWRGHVSDLRPTAGYSKDAWRFRNDIAAKQCELGIDDGIIWRTR